MKNILICLDFHEKTSMLIDKALELAKTFGSKIWLLHVAAPDPDFVGYEVGPQYIRDARANELKMEHKILLEYENKLTESGIEAESLMIQGATIELILEEAKKLNISLIVTGHHHHGFFYKAFIGSISSQIISKSNIPVLVVPFG